MQNDMITYMLRIIGWQLIRFLRWLTNMTEGFLTDTYKLLTFAVDDNEVISKFIARFQPIFVLIFAGALVAIGVSLMMDTLEDYRKPIRNVAIVILVFTGLPSLMSLLGRATTTGINAVNQIDSQQANASDRIIADNLWDFLYIDGQNFNTTSNNGFHNTNDDAISKIDVVETINPSKQRHTLNNAEVFRNELVTDQNGNVTVDTIYFGGLIDFWRPYYYRYNYDFVSIAVCLIVSIVVFLATGFKVVRICYDLAFHRIFAAFVAPGDITSGQRIKKILMSIFAMYVTVLTTAVTYKCFLLFQAYINGLNIGTFSKVLMYIPAALAVIDGPNIVQQIFGLDAGINSIFRTTMAAVHGAQLAVGGARALSRTAGSAAGGAATVGGFGAGVGAGIYAGGKNRINKMNPESEFAKAAAEMDKKNGTGSETPRSDDKEMLREQENQAAKGSGNNDQAVSVASSEIPQDSESSNTRAQTNAVDNPLDQSFDASGMEKDNSPHIGAQDDNKNGLDSLQDKSDIMTRSDLIKPEHQDGRLKSTAKSTYEKGKYHTMKWTLPKKGLDDDEKK